ncbi:MAG: hypothetical protein R8K49_00005 [Mariprofundaceae bacterium]
MQKGQRPYGEGRAMQDAKAELTPVSHSIHPELWHKLVVQTAATFLRAVFLTQALAKLGRAE